MKTEEDHSLRAFMTEPRRETWGRWHLDVDACCLEILDGATSRYIPLDRCQSDADRWFWTKHYAGKGWMTSDDVKNLVAALHQLALDAVMA